MAANGETVTILRVTEGRAVIAPATPEGVARWLALPLAPDELARLLVGQVRPLREPDSVQTVLNDGVPTVEITRGGLRQRVWVGPGGAPWRVEFQGERRLEATFKRAVNGQVMAVQFVAPEHGAEVRLRYHSVEVGAVPTEAFTLRLPAEVSVQRVD